MNDAPKRTEIPKMHIDHLGTLPDFLGVGVQRSGTTWLWKNLGRHPEIWLPPMKEIHYFDRYYPSCPGFFARLLSKEFDDRRWRRSLRNRFLRNMRNPAWNRFVWDLKYFLSRYDDRWYASLFKEGQDKVKGEITPPYSALEPDTIEHVRDIMPEAKIIFMIRNPITRAWSQIRYNTRINNQTLDSLSLADVARMTNGKTFALRGDSVRGINSWRRCFPKEQLFIGFFDDISRNPQQLLLRIFEFVGVEASEEHLTSLVSEKVNPSPPKRIPTEIRLYLAERYYPQIKTLSDMLGGHADEWLKEAEELLKNEKLEH